MFLHQTVHIPMSVPLHSLDPVIGKLPDRDMQESLFQVRISGKTPDGLMKLEIGINKGLKVAVVGGFQHPVEELLQMASRALDVLLQSQAHRQAFQLASHQINLAAFFIAQLDNKRAPVRELDHQSQVLEFFQRLAHRGLPHSDLPSNAKLDQLFSRLQFSDVDRVTKTLGDTAGERLRLDATQDSFDIADESSHKSRDNLLSIIQSCQAFLFTLSWLEGCAWLSDLFHRRFHYDWDW